jgi:hypothetical protein
MYPDARETTSGEGGSSGNGSTVRCTTEGHLTAEWFPDFVYRCDNEMTDVVQYNGILYIRTYGGGHADSADNPPDENTACWEPFVWAPQGSSGSAVTVKRASTTQHGVVKIGANINVTDGIISVPNTDFQANWTQTETTAKDFIKNKPAVISDRTDMTTGIPYGRMKQIGGEVSWEAINIEKVAIHDLFLSDNINDPYPPLPFDNNHSVYVYYFSSNGRSPSLNFADPDAIYASFFDSLPSFKLYIFYFINATSNSNTIVVPDSWKGTPYPTAGLVSFLSGGIFKLEMLKLSIFGSVSYFAKY